MKILYIAPSFIPSRTANSVHVMKMCNAIGNIGHDVTLVTRGSNKTISDYNYYDVDNNFRIAKINFFNIRFINSIIFLFFTLFKIIQIKPELIYTRYRFSLILNFLLKIPIIFEDHSPPNGFYKKIIQKALKKNVIKIIVISSALKKIYLHSIPKIKSDKIIIAHDGANPINISSNSTIDTIRLNKKSLNIGYIGHLHKGRGIDMILGIAEKISTHDFHIIGGETKDINYWKDLNKQKNVIFHGYKINSEISKLLIQFDILLAPYQYKVFINSGLNTASWMSPLKVFEYMSAGKAIISSKLDVLEEVLSHNFNALMVKPDNLNDWVNAVNILIEDKQLRERLGNQALKDFKNKFTWEKRVAYILNSALN
jgi:glycosyltransferase involved in cell wall biosynthesis